VIIDGVEPVSSIRADHGSVIIQINLARAGIRLSNSCMTILNWLLKLSLRSVRKLKKCRPHKHTVGFGFNNKKTVSP
jgi:hypothetical protein